MNKSRAITKKHLSQHLEVTVGLEPAVALSIVENFFDQMIECLKKKHIIKLTGLGTFSVNAKKSRLGRNVKTGEAVAIHARNVVKFTASVQLRKILHQLTLPTIGA